MLGTEQFKLPVLMSPQDSPSPKVPLTALHLTNTSPRSPRVVSAASFLLKPWVLERNQRLQVSLASPVQTGPDRPPAGPYLAPWGPLLTSWPRYTFVGIALIINEVL